MADINHHEHHDAKASAPEFMLTAKTQTPLKENESTQVTLFLTDKKGTGVGEDKLKTIHTEKIHALIIDPTLTDYQHIHPKPGQKNGEYVFDFTPHTPNAYRLWLDITPVNGAQQYIMTDLSGAQASAPILKKLATNSSVDGYDFKLSFDKPLKVGEGVMGSVIITDKNGKAVTRLEPIMEAFAHIVAFNEDYHTILHVHPLGVEPKDLTLRGGPKIDFHLTPTQAGYVKIFVQVKIDGKEIIAPFGVKIT
jgi:hypothetical protein